jgi:hypothetical protein
MGTATAERATPNATDLHSDCWRTLSRASAAGCDVTYLPTGQPVPSHAALLSCLVCGDRWLVTRSWLALLRRQLLAVAITDGTAGRSVA